MGSGISEGATSYHLDLLRPLILDIPRTGKEITDRFFALARAYGAKKVRQTFNHVEDLLYTADKIVVYQSGYTNEMIRTKESDIEPLHGIFRVSVEVNDVSIVHLGVMNVDLAKEGEYADVHALPKWVQERIAVLMMLSFPPSQRVEGIGRRISENVYWVYEPEENQNA